MAKTKEYHGELVEKRSQIGEIWKRFRRNKLAMVGMCIVVFMILLAIFANVLSPYDPYLQVDDPLQFPSLKHWFGTDNYGRDLLSRVLYGARVSLLVALLALVISLVVGGVLGATAGYFGGAYDTFIMRLMDVLMAIPSMLLAVCVSALLGNGTINTAVAVAVGGIAQNARLLRSTVLSIRGQEYVEAAKSCGSGHMRIILRQVLPNTLSPVLVNTSLGLSGNILQISGLSFIGLGVQPPTPEWGSIINVGRTYITSFYPMIVFPGIAIAITAFGFNVMGDGLRDALDPKLKR